MECCSDAGAAGGAEVGVEVQFWVRVWLRHLAKLLGGWPIWVLSIRAGLERMFKRLDI